jgi:hypothetical protein
MPHCPNCNCDFDDTVAACPYCGSDLIDDRPDDELHDSDSDEFISEDGGIDVDSAVLLYKSYSRLNTDFLVETLKSAKIPCFCKLIGGLYGRGMPGSVGLFGTEAVDAEIYVPEEYDEEAQEIRRQTVGD